MATQSSQCLTPFMLTQKLRDSLPVPCGKCPHCLKRRASWWSFRLMQECKYSVSAYTLTLTYDVDNVPITKRGLMSLSSPRVSDTGKAVGSDMQSFFKRLRKRDNGKAVKPLKYYYVGEYGDGTGNTRTRRPHYHAILFNAELSDLIDSKDIMIIERHGWDSKRHVMFKDWNKGHGSIDIVSPASVGYCLKYISKEKDIPCFEGDDRNPPFAHMSKGLGAEYLNPEMIAWHMADSCNRMYVNVGDGKKASMPRYYKDKLYGKELREQIGITVRQKMVQKELDEWKMLSPEQRENRINGYNEGVKAAFRALYEKSKQNNSF